MLFDEATAARLNVTGLQRIQRGQDIVGFETNRAVWYEHWPLAESRIATRALRHRSRPIEGETSVVDWSPPILKFEYRFV
jgi:hypothetical protein